MCHEKENKKVSRIGFVFFFFFYSFFNRLLLLVILYFFIPSSFSLSCLPSVQWGFSGRALTWLFDTTPTHSMSPHFLQYSCLIQSGFSTFSPSHSLVLLLLFHYTCRVSLFLPIDLLSPSLSLSLYAVAYTSPGLYGTLVYNVNSSS